MARILSLTAASFVPYFSSLTMTNIVGGGVRRRSLCNSDQVKRLKIMFFGTDDFALQTLIKLHSEISHNYSSGCVKELEVTCLKMKTLIPPVAKYAKENKLKIHIWPPNLETIVNDNFDLGVVSSFGQLIPAKVITSFPLGMINVHGSLLPSWRGAAPVIHALNSGDSVTGVSIMRIKPARFDVGEIFAAKEMDIGNDVRRPELTAQLAVLGADLLMDVLSDYRRIASQAWDQGEEGVSYAPLVGKEMALLDFELMSSREVYNRWRAVGDMIKLRVLYKGVTVRLTTCLPPDQLRGLDLNQYQASPPGSIIYFKGGKKRKYLCVKCGGGGWVAFTGIYYGNKKVMSPTDFYNGFLSKPGEHQFSKNSL